MIEMNQFKKYYLYSLIGSLTSVAIVAVVTILIGTFSDLTARVIGTLSLVVVHSLISLSLIKDENSKINTLSFFSDTLFLLLVSSLITSLLAVWGGIGGELTSKLYSLFFVLGFSAFHSNSIFLIRNKGPLISKLVRINQYFIAVTAFMVVPAIIIENMDDMYYRLLGSVAVIDVTLTVVSVILYKLYLQKHPGEKNELAFNKSSGVLKVLVLLVLAYFLLQIVFSLLFFAFSGFGD